MYGGVMKGIIKMMSNHFLLAICVRAVKNARGMASSVEHMTTATPNNSVLVIVVMLFVSVTVLINREKSKLPSMIIALVKITIKGMITSTSRTRHMGSIAPYVRNFFDRV
jgi:hypothetical protein